MSRVVKNSWHNTIFNSDSLPRPVEVLSPKVVTAEQCSVRSNKTIPP